jgi:hypothetical protein
MAVEAMSEMQRQLHATSACLVWCGMRAHEGTIAQACRHTASATACNSILPEKAALLLNLSLGKETVRRIDKETMFRYHIFSSSV